MMTKSNHPRGAVLVFALLLLVVGATILGGITQVAVTHVRASQSEWDAVARRVQLENSRALARQYILTQCWRGYGELPSGSLSASATGGLGGFAITNVDPELGFWLSLDQPTATNRINPFNIFERGGFQSAWASGSLVAASENVPWGFQIRTRSPIVAGFAFVNHLPATNVWAPERRIYMRTNDYADYAVGFSALPRMPVSSITNTNVAPGIVTMATLGALNVPRAEAAFGELLEIGEPGVTTSNNEIQLDLEQIANTLAFYEVPNWEFSGTNANAIHQLRLVGTTNSALPPVQVYVPASSFNLTNVTLSGDNRRAVYLFRKGTNVNTLIRTTSGSTRNWRFGATLEGNANLDIAGLLTITGGIRTGGQLVQVSANAPTFVSEMAPTADYDAVADRLMWLEDQRVRNE